MAYEMSFPKSWQEFSSSISFIFNQPKSEFRIQSHLIHDLSPQFVVFSTLAFVPVYILHFCMLLQILFILYHQTCMLLVCIFSFLINLNICYSNETTSNWIIIYILLNLKFKFSVQRWYKIEIW